MGDEANADAPGTRARVSRRARVSGERAVATAQGHAPRTHAGSAVARRRCARPLRLRWPGARDRVDAHPRAHPRPHHLRVRRHPRRRDRRRRDRLVAGRVASSAARPRRPHGSRYRWPPRPWPPATPTRSPDATCRSSWRSNSRRVRLTPATGSRAARGSPPRSSCRRRSASARRFPWPSRWPARPPAMSPAAPGWSTRSTPWARCRGRWLRASC